MELLACLFLVSTLFGGGIALGLRASDRLDIARKRRLTRQEAAVQADMDALMRAQQLNAAFLSARRGMWEEARRHRMSGYE